MTQTVAMLVTAETKTQVENDINALTPEYTIGFLRKVAATDPNMLPDQTPTYWYLNGQSVPDDTAGKWAAYAETAPGLMMFSAVNAVNPLGWAITNLASQGLQFVPDEV
jgi:hypothetical protein